MQTKRSAASDNYMILEADTPERYAALRDLWCRVFGDEPGYVDSMFECFGDEIRGYIAVEADDAAKGEACDAVRSELPGERESGRVRALSALTCYRCGELTISDVDMEEVCGKPVYVSYAVCTDPEYRGLGLAGMLTSHVRDLVTAAGGLSIVSPADESLQDFYSGLGYRPFFYASVASIYADETAFGGFGGFAGFDGFDDYDSDYFDGFGDFDSDRFDGGPDKVEELWADDDTPPFEPELDVKELDAATYNRYREAFLMDEPHIVLTESMLEFVRRDSMGGRGLLSINGGDAICAVSYAGDSSVGGGRAEGGDAGSAAGGGRLVLSELIVNPMLAEISAEIGSEIAGRLAKHFGAKMAEYREPGMRYCQSMIAGRLAATEAGMPRAAYFGFPLD